MVVSIVGQIKENKMRVLAEKTGLTFDGGDDTRLFIEDSRFIEVHAPTLGYNYYRTMEKELRDFEIDKEKYTVRAWNDCGGWEYWKKEGLLGSTNYIQVTVHIKDVNLTEKEVVELIHDTNEVYDKFCWYHNTDQVDWEKYLG